MEWKYSSMGLRALAFRLKQLPYAAKALAVMRPETRAAIENPSSTSWHDGMVVLDLLVAVRQFASDEGVEALNYDAVKHSLGPVLAPFLKVTLALFGGSPESIFKRMNDSIGTVMKNVRAEWKPTGPSQGRLTLTYPDDVNDVSYASWKGSLRFVFDLCAVKGVITPRPAEATARSIVFDCSWS